MVFLCPATENRNYKVGYTVWKLRIFCVERPQPPVSILKTLDVKVVEDERVELTAFTVCRYSIPNNSSKPRCWNPPTERSEWARAKSVRKRAVKSRKSKSSWPPSVRCPGANRSFQMRLDGTFSTSFFRLGTTHQIIPMFIHIKLVFAKNRYETDEIKKAAPD